MTPPSSIDLETLSPRHTLELRVEAEENPAERDARLVRESAQAAHDRWKSTLAFLAFMGAAVAVGAIAAFILLRDTSSVDDRRWAATALSSLLTGALAFLAGFKSGQSTK